MKTFVALLLLLPSVAGAACPKPADLIARVRVLLKSGGDEVGVDGCVEGRFPRPGWTVAAWTAKPDASVKGRPLEWTEHPLIIDAGDGSLVARGEPENANVNIIYSAPRCADFDGDGIDEILWESSDTTGGGTEDQLQVLRLHERRLTPALALATRYEYGEVAMDEPDPRRAVSYRAKIAVTAPDASGARGLVVVGELKAGKRADRERLKKLIVKRKVFRMKDGLLRPSDH